MWKFTDGGCVCVCVCVGGGVSEREKNCEGNKGRKKAVREILMSA